MNETRMSQPISLKGRDLLPDASEPPHLQRLVIGSPTRRYWDGTRSFVANGCGFWAL
jgi:hypothetical protein